MAVDDDDVVPVQSTRPPTVFKVIGDHQQLRPLVFSRAKENPFQSQLQISLFTRLKLNGFMDVMFTDQHCMVGDLCNMINDVFYASKLSTAANLEGTVPALGVCRLEICNTLSFNRASQVEDEETGIGRLSINPSGTYQGSDTGSGLEGESLRSGKVYQVYTPCVKNNIRLTIHRLEGISQERERDLTEHSRISLVHSESVDLKGVLLIQDEDPKEVEVNGWIPLTKCKFSEKIAGIVLGGDTWQLQPTVLTANEQPGWNEFSLQIEMSLVVRLTRANHLVLKLREQRRFRPCVTEFLNERIYKGEMRSHHTTSSTECFNPKHVTVESREMNRKRWACRGAYEVSLSPERDKPVEPANALPLAPAPAALPAATVLAVVNNFSRSVMGLSIHRDVNFTIECYPWDGRSSPQYKNAGEYGSRGMVEKILPYIQRSHPDILQFPLPYCSLMSTLLSKRSRKECEEVLRLIKNSGNAGASACSMETAAPLDAPTESSQSEEEFASSGTIVPQTQSGVGVRAPQIPTPEVPESSIARRPSMPLWNPCNRKKGALLPSMVLDDDSEFSYTSTQSVLTNATTAPANATDIVHILRKVCPRMLAIAKEWIDIEGSAEPPTEETTAKIVQALAELGYLIGDELGRADNV
ncbi:hypothetical protein CDV55_101040 [Aspergillus turcosus]|nr:hypothetical protein CDV55_101040 [Aspergillus turcosus]